MTSSASSRLGGSYVIDGIFLNDLREIIAEIEQHNDIALTAETNAKMASRNYYKSAKEKQAASQSYRETWAPSYTKVVVTYTQKNGTVRHDVGFDSILSANKLDDRGIQALEVKIGSMNWGRFLKIEIANSYTPISFLLSGDHEWVDYTKGRLEKLIQSRKQFWGLFSPSFWPWLVFILILPYLLLLPLAAFKYLFGSLFSPFVLNALKSYAVAIDGNSNLFFSLQLVAVILAFFFDKKISKIWEWLFPKITFMFGDAEVDGKKRAKIRLALVTMPITSVILPVLVDKI